MADGPELGDQRSGRDVFKEFLQSYGLGALADDDALWNASKAKSEDEWWLDVQKTPTYQSRFRGIVELKAKAARGEYVPYIPSIKEYVQLEAGYKQKAMDYQLPAGFYDSADDFANLIAGGVSVDEYSNRLRMAQQAALGSDPTLRNEISRLIPGVGIGDLTSFFLDPAKGDEVLQERFNQAQFGAASIRSGFGVLSRSEIEGLQATTSLDQAQAGFDLLSQSGQILGADSTQEGMTREQQLALARGEAGAQTEFKTRQRKKVAAFEGGGGYAASQEGITGLGSS